MIKLRLTLITLLLAGSCGAPVALLAQDMEQANQHFNNYEYALALNDYQNALKNGKASLTVVQRIADSYRLLNNSQEAEQWYAKVVTYSNAAPINTYYYAQAAKQNGHYEKAKKLFLEYRQKAPEQAAVAMQMAASTDTAVAWIQNPRSYKVQIVNDLNSKAGDYSPVKEKDGLFFASTRLGAANSEQNATASTYVQLYYAKANNDSTWQTPVPLSPIINTAYHNGPAAFSQTDQTLYFTRTQVNKRNVGKLIADPTSWLRGKSNGNSTHTNHHGIFIADRKDGKWENVRPFKYNNSKAYSVGHPAVTPDGKVLYFVSDMPGSLGDTDIFYSERQADGSWGAPVNAGNVINTSGRESFPTIGEDGNLYFSSNGHLGMGGLDIFKAVGSHNAWSKVENMRAPINSSNDDFSLLIDAAGKAGMFSSARAAQGGSDNIYSFKEVKKQPLVLKGQVIAKAGKADSVRKQVTPIDSVLLQLTESGSTKPVELYTDEDGNFSFEVKPGKTYTLRGSKEDYLSQNLTIVADSSLMSDSYQLEFVLERKRVNVPVVLNNVYYDLDKAVIRPEAAAELNKLIKIMKDNPDVMIEIGSHTDSRGHRKYNRLLSERRANSVVDYLISKGIDKSRLTATGYGESQLINECNDAKRRSCSEEMHQQNRRTEFKIIK
ncbi:OmpA family protein [Pontibacter sp. MBLB2868]|uniref:OmpA family protein n=1 Tax=Pontibacter sp. MBLB2868 TaxID=3451555 RepID=UPI003F751CBE